MGMAIGSRDALHERFFSSASTELYYVRRQDIRWSLEVHGPAADNRKPRSALPRETLAAKCRVRAFLCAAETLASYLGARGPKSSKTHGHAFFGTAHDQRMWHVKSWKLICLTHIVASASAYSRHAKEEEEKTSLNARAGLLPRARSRVDTLM